ncbi:DNA-binding transcriptional regulator, CsgD family [Limimonas halophila]|uniref:DNA-binding transcriptional regulator, CsgD family n=1 Tax=Limimonas halophila TaxID=1082479 RepID=A0A1G7S5V7_9PROT|nr:LuxR family transcriptional regulator [Limimonas halophila]SDG18406.1 DNA-binding transcriptional regulator, CsgD family [Limimonas halophila]
MEPQLGVRLPERVVTDLESAPTLTEIERIAADFLNDIGFKQYSYYMARRRPHGERLEGYFSNFDRRWITRYLEKNYVCDDLLHVNARRSVLPFTWMPRSKGHIPARSAQVFSEAQDYGIRDGVAIPVHGPDTFALVTAIADGSPREREEILTYTRDAVTSLALHVHERASNVLEATGGAGLTDDAVLTERERECLRWVAAGKTSGEIGDILGIAEGTVGQHIANVRRKLQTPTRAHAAVRAMHFALIDAA